ncbi:MAG: hypothetical protein M3M85_04530, partial [bacterium]|nr:hypothetical protein [bacterium]
MSLYWTKKVEADKVIYTASNKSKRYSQACAFMGIILLIGLSLHVYKGYLPQLADHPYVFLFSGALGFLLVGVAVFPTALL